MTQCWGDEYFHFLAEALPRITFMLDVLQENLDIKVPFHSLSFLHHISGIHHDGAVNGLCMYFCVGYPDGTCFLYTSRTFSRACPTVRHCDV